MRPAVLTITVRSSGFLGGADPARVLLSTSASARLLPRLYHSTQTVNMVFRGPRQELVERRLQAKFPSALHMEVANESHGRQEDESHFHVLIVDEAFDGVKLIQRHRMVNEAVAEEDGTLGFHSVRITAKAPDQWAENPKVPSAPKCTGKGDGVPGR